MIPLASPAPSVIPIASSVISCCCDSRTAGLDQEIENLKKKLATCIRARSDLQEELSEAYHVKSQLADLHAIFQLGQFCPLILAILPIAQAIRMLSFFSLFFQLLDLWGLIVVGSAWMLLAHVAFLPPPRRSFVFLFSAWVSDVNSWRERDKFWADFSPSQPSTALPLAIQRKPATTSTPVAPQLS